MSKGPQIPFQFTTSKPRLGVRPRVVFLDTLVG